MNLSKYNSKEKHLLQIGVLNRGYLFFSVKDRNLFQVNIIVNIFISGAATSENITHDVHNMK